MSFIKGERVECIVQDRTRSTPKEFMREGVVEKVNAETVRVRFSNTVVKNVPRKFVRQKGEVK